MANHNDVARRLRALHKPGHPIILTNVYDIVSAEAIASLPSCHALATASYAVARAAGTDDDDMTLETNLAAVEAISKVATKYNKLLTADFQDGYGPRLEEGVTSLLKLGVAGINLEDCNKSTQQMYSPEEAVARIKTVLEVAKRAGVPEFVVNARCDVLVQGGHLDEVLERGKMYLNAGATTVFVWGGAKRGVTRAEVERMAKEIGGRLNVSLLTKVRGEGGLSVNEVEEMGVLEQVQ